MPPSPPPSPSLDDLRDRIHALDAELIALAAERVALARQVGDVKRAAALPTVDPAREAAVFEHAVSVAVDRGLAPHVAEQLLTSLVHAAVSAQDEDSLRFAATGAGKTAVVVGGAGRMGRWITRFLVTQGYTAGALDPAAPDDEQAWAHATFRDADLVVCSVPPAATADLYMEWCADPPRGIVVDIASIKTPLIAPIRALRAAEARVASIHPMFGPSIVLLRDADVVICETGDAAATDAVERLFRPTTARLIRVGLEEHDRIMGDLLSLAHATAIAFALALPGRDHAVRSTTFQKLESLAASLVRESADVYYEIQARNPHSADAIARLRTALERVAQAASASDAEEFRALFTQAQRSTPEPG